MTKISSFAAVSYFWPRSYLNFFQSCLYCFGVIKFPYLISQPFLAHQRQEKKTTQNLIVRNGGSCHACKDIVCRLKFGSICSISYDEILRLSIHFFKQETKPKKIQKIKPLFTSKRVEYMINFQRKNRLCIIKNKIHYFSWWKFAIVF